MSNQYAPLGRALSSHLLKSILFGLLTLQNLSTLLVLQIVKGNSMRTLHRQKTKRSKSHVMETHYSWHNCVSHKAPTRFLLHPNSLHLASNLQDFFPLAYICTDV